MPYSAMTPETIFRQKPASPDDILFCFGEPSHRVSEQEQYKRLIDEQAAKIGLPLAHLADRLKIGRPRLHKVIRNNLTLKDELRDRVFDALGIDCVRAKFCVAFLHDHTAYDDPNVFLVCEGLKSFYCEIISRRRGEIHVALRPPVIHEALGRAYELLLSHQARVMENDRTLQA